MTNNQAATSSLVPGGRGDWAALAVLLAGVALALVQFVFNRSVGGDEASLSLGILQRDFAGLLKPLDRDQVAPILFLWVQKLMTLLIPHSELGLRLFPLLAWTASLVMVWGVLRKTLGSRAVVVFGLAVFVLDQTLLRYSNEGKQYIGDVLLMASAFSLVFSSPGPRRLILLGLLGAAGVFLSNVAPVILLCTGVCLLYECWSRGWKDIVWLAVIALLWTMAFAVYYALFISNHPTKDMMVGYWEDQGKFMPWNPLTREFWLFAKGVAATLFRDILGFGAAGALIFGVLSALGVFAAVRKRRFDLLALSVLPIVVHLALSALTLYPFATRLGLYLVVGLVVLSALGLELLLELPFLLRHRAWFRWVVPAAVLALAAVFVLRGYPYRALEVRPALDYLRTNAEGDTIYLYYGAEKVLNFYRALGYPVPTNVVVGARHRDDPSGYIAEIDALRGRVWVLLAFLKPNSDSAYIVKTLEARGLKLERQFRAPGNVRTFLIWPKMSD